jgi:hypothetical protein
LRNTVLSEKERKEKYASLQKNENALGMLTTRKYKHRCPKVKKMNTQ